MAKISRIMIGAEASVNFQKGIVHFELELDGTENSQDIQNLVAQTKAVAQAEAHKTAIALSALEKGGETPKKEYTPAPKKEYVAQSKPAYTPKPAVVEYNNTGTYKITDGQKKLLAFKKVPKDVELHINSYQEFNDFIQSL